jgi:hypothetical protein
MKEAEGAVVQKVRKGEGAKGTAGLHIANPTAERLGRRDLPARIIIIHPPAVYT